MKIRSWKENIKVNKVRNIKKKKKIKKKKQKFLNKKI